MVRRKKRLPPPPQDDSDDNTCSKCKKTFSNTSNRNQHMRTIHGDPISGRKTKYACKFCDKKYKSNQRRLSHEESSHLSKYRYTHNLNKQDQRSKAPWTSPFHQL